MLDTKGDVSETKSCKKSAITDIWIMFHQQNYARVTQADASCRANERSPYAINKVTTVRNVSSVTPDVSFKFSDAQIQPMLLYESEAWGMDDCQVVRSIHLRGLKSFLSVSPCNPNEIV